MILRIFTTFLTHVISAIGAFAALGLIHILSGRGIWALFPCAHHVRQLSVYVLSALPFFFATLVVLLFLYAFIFHIKKMRLPAFYGVGLAAVIVTVFLHRPFFSSDSRAATFLILFAVLYLSIYAVITGITEIRQTGGNSWKPFPALTNPFSGAMIGLSAAFLYVGGFMGAEKFAGLEEDATYIEAKSLIPASPGNNSAEMSDLTEFAADLFTLEPLPIKGSHARLADMNGDGFTDVMVKNSSGQVELWLNEQGIFKKHNGFLNGVDSSNIHDFYSADFDNDGDLDLIVSKYVENRPSEFTNTFLKKIYWYPGNDITNTGHLFRQQDLGKWDDVTKRSFPGGQPTALRKVEPILWFDANGDGRLDFVWSQYPHPRKLLNALYVQNPDGTFTDQFSSRISGSSTGVYAEGSDVADYDDDGDIDLFAYGFLYRNEGGKFKQVCGDEFPGLFCNARGRNDEGATFEDINGDGAMDLLISHHGPKAGMPKYYLQLFLADKNKPGSFQRIKSVERKFYGFNTYLRGKDFDFNGKPDILIRSPGRLVTFKDNDLFDLFPAITKKPIGHYQPVGWMDVDEDGDWDFIAEREKDSRYFLFRNGLNPESVVKISASGEGGKHNQSGATIRITDSNKLSILASYRSLGGYAGSTDPRIVFPLVLDKDYDIHACFPSFSGKIVQPQIQEGIELTIVKSKAPCVDYKLRVTGNIARLDLNLVSGPPGAVISTVKKQIH